MSTASIFRRPCLGNNSSAFWFHVLPTSTTIVLCRRWCHLPLSANNHERNLHFVLSVSTPSHDPSITSNIFSAVQRSRCCAACALRFSWRACEALYERQSRTSPSTHK